MPEATVAIVTRNRRAELRRALRSVLEQDVPLDVLVVDDGSTDGTADAVRREFPSVRVERFATSAGLVVRRNDAARLARGRVVISIDDDAELSSPHTVRQTLAEFDDPRIAVVAIPYLDVAAGDGVRQRAPAPGRWITGTFRGTAYAVRRDLFLDLGGFRETIVHQGEEPDFCLRLLERGHLVRLGNAPPIRHHESPSRSLERMAFYGRRNELLFAFTHLPFPENVLRAALWTGRGLRVGARLGLWGPTLRGLLAGVRSCWELRDERRPLPRPVVRLDRRLRRPVRLDELPPLPVAP